MKIARAVYYVSINILLSIVVPSYKPNLSQHENQNSVNDFTYPMLITWWMRQKVSKIMRRAFSTNSSRHAIRKKSDSSTAWHWFSFRRAASKSKFTYRCSMNSVIGSLEKQKFQKLNSTAYDSYLPS